MWVQFDELCLILLSIWHAGLEICLEMTELSIPNITIHSRAFANWNWSILLAVNIIQSIT